MEKFLLAICLVLTISACTSSTIIVPQTDGTLVTIATDANKKQAIKLATTKSQKICDRQNMSIKINDLEIIHQGLDKDQQQLVRLARELLPKHKTSGSYIPTSQEFKSIMTFRCE